MVGPVAAVGTWTIPVVVDADTAPDESKSLLSRGAAKVCTAVDAEKLKENMANRVKYLHRLLLQPQRFPANSIYPSSKQELKFARMAESLS